jgi:hypothetical protein
MSTVSRPRWRFGAGRRFSRPGCQVPDILAHLFFRQLNVSHVGQVPDSSGGSRVCIHASEGSLEINHGPVDVIIS